MGKILQLKRCLAAAVIAFLGVTATWADATVVYEADMSQTNEPDGWKCYKPKDMGKGSSDNRSLKLSHICFVY